ncbi:MAG: 23S rRNA (guanosine(2251)-2'-O)-methyltransferase RlmB [Firmicutes bacterium]|nr:23S rRNA (guanosine(2251)-2'-O)-methyltransferase RlmB [Bacillota bacterium]
MIVYGMNVLKEMNPRRIKKVYCSRKDIIEYLKENKIKYELKDNNFLNKMTKNNHQGIIIDVHDYEYYQLQEIESSFVVILDHLEDPHNFGAIIRTCVAAGVKEIIIPKDRSVKVTDTVVKVSAGMIENIKIIMVSNLVDAIKKLQKKGYFVYSADMDGEDYQKINYSEKKILVIGNEGKGISRLVKENSDVIVTIPISKNAESLNASVAAGIIIYEMRD